ncbi:unnamed protein product, partial [Polarella glacialis]
RPPRGQQPPVSEGAAWLGGLFPSHSFMLLEVDGGQMIICAEYFAGAAGGRALQGGLGPRLQSPWAPQVTVRNLLDWLRSPAAGGHEAQDHATSHAEHCPFVPGPASSSGSRFAFDLLAFLTGQVALQVPEVPDPPALRSSAKGRSGLLLRALSGCRADEPVP